MSHVVSGYHISVAPLNTNDCISIVKNNFLINEIFNDRQKLIISKTYDQKLIEGLKTSRELALLDNLIFIHRLIG